MTTGTPEAVLSHGLADADEIAVLSHGLFIGDEDDAPDPMVVTGTWADYNVTGTWGD